MTWNYRVISHPSWNTWDKEGERIYKIHEVFSDETGIIGYSAEGCKPFGESKKDLIIDLSYMAKAFEKASAECRGYAHNKVWRVIWRGRYIN